MKKQLTHNIFHSMSHLEGNDIAFHKQTGNHKGCTADKADLSSQ